MHYYYLQHMAVYQLICVAHRILQNSCGFDKRNHRGTLQVTHIMELPLLQMVGQLRNTR